MYKERDFMNIAPLNIISFKGIEKNKLNISSGMENELAITSADDILKSLDIASLAQKTDIELKRPSSTALYGINLINRTLSGEEVDFKQEIKKFLSAYGIDNIEVKNLSDVDERIKNEQLAAGFLGKYDDDLQENGGIIYLEELKNRKDPKAVQQHVALMMHELTHALQHKNDEEAAKIFSKNGKIDLIQQRLIFGFTNIIASPMASVMQMRPLQYIFNNYQRYDIPRYELYNMNADIKSYGTIFPAKSNKNISEQTVYSTFGGKDNFENTVIQYFQQIVAKLNEAPDSKDYQTLETYDMLKDFFVARLRNEAEAYQVMSDINKKLKNINERYHTLNDLIPITYNMVADVLEETELAVV